MTYSEVEKCLKCYGEFSEYPDEDRRMDRNGEVEGSTDESLYLKMPNL